MTIPLSLPENLGRCTEQFEGDPALTIHLVALPMGHSPDAEKAVARILDFLHRLTPLHHLFNLWTDLDAPFGDVDIQQFLDKWRRYPDRESLLEVAGYLLNTGLVSAGLVFGLASEPRVPVHELDDWYGWALQRDALASLNAEAGKLILLESFLKNLTAQARSAHDVVEKLFVHICLEWTGREWVENKPTIELLDPAYLLSPLAQQLPAFDPIIRGG